MGGRGQGSATSRSMRVVSEEQHLAARGVSNVISDYTLDTTRLPHGETARQREARIKATLDNAREYQAKRDEARMEYRSLVDRGEFRAPTKIESMVRTAHGHPDNESVKAARRALAKRGIDWKTGSKQA